MIDIDLKALKKDELIILINALDRKLDELKEEMQNKSYLTQGIIEESNKKHNERNAGRKPKLTNETKDKILDLHLNKNLSHRKIALQVGVSASTTFKVIQEYKKTLETANKCE